MRWMVGALVVAALALGGCSDSGTTGGEPAAAVSTVQPRSVAVVWADILGQRDQIYSAVSKGTDMWHEDCAQVSAAAAAMDALAVELGKSIVVIPSSDPRRGGVELLLGYLQTTTSSLRSAAIEEHVGSLPAMMIGLDALLQGIESHLTREELGAESVVKRPGFNPVRPPPPPSPI